MSNFWHFITNYAIKYLPFWNWVDEFLCLLGKFPVKILTLCCCSNKICRGKKRRLHTFIQFTSKKNIGSTIDNKIFFFIYFIKKFPCFFRCGWSTLPQQPWIGFTVIFIKTKPSKLCSKSACFEWAIVQFHTSLPLVDFLAQK